LLLILLKESRRNCN